MPKCSGGQKVISPQDLSWFFFAHSLPIISLFPYFTPKTVKKDKLQINPRCKINVFSKGVKRTGEERSTDHNDPLKRDEKGD